MRIRKRQVPLPFSSLSPVPLSVSDPYLNQSPVVVQQPSSHQQIGTRTNDSDENIKDCLLSLQDEKGGRSVNGIIREKNISGAEMGSSSQQDIVGRRWYDEGDKSFPLKKRRGSFQETTRSALVKKMKTKINKKFALQDDDKETTSVNKTSRGGVLMEGSRCSRVNGRGWRCCQQTLVGYSLCEHHLGKGRLRSITSATPNTNNTNHPLSNTISLSLQEHNNKPNPIYHAAPHQGQQQHQKPLMITKKRMRLGMVKARSISSLLGQTISNDIKPNCEGN